MPNIYKFYEAEKTRDKLTAKQEKEIKKLYKECSKEIDNKISYYENRQNVSSVVRTQELLKLKKEINESLTRVGKQTETLIKNTMNSVAKAVAEDNLGMLRQMGFGGTVKDYFKFSEDAVEKLVTGKVYDNGWGLSSRIWGVTDKAQKDVYNIVSKGVVEGKSTFEIAKDLKAYVDPNARKDWSWSKVYPGSNKVVDYNAQRLARTLVTHSYQQSFVENTKNNPFVKKYMWVSNGSRVCPICKDRDGAIYDKDSLPLDHPNGMCYVEAVIEDWNKITDDLADWINGGDNADLDAFAKSLGYNMQ